MGVRTAYMMAGVRSELAVAAVATTAPVLPRAPATALTYEVMVDDEKALVAVTGSPKSEQGSEWQTHARNLVVAAIGAVPLVGSPISTLLDKYLPDLRARRTEEFLGRLDADLNRLKAITGEAYFQSDEFMAIFLRCVRRAEEEHHEEKREALRAIVVNSAMPHDNAFDEVTLFIRLIGDLTLDQMRILRLVRDNVAAKDGGGLLTVVMGFWPEADRAYLQACVTELLRYNLVTSSKTSAASSDVHRLTTLGERFLAYLQVPSA